MFANIRRHQKWLWILISTLVIISFVWFFNPDAQYAQGQGEIATMGTINGQDISRNHYQNIVKEAYIKYFFSFGEWYQDNEMNRQIWPMEREIRNRLMLIHKLGEYDIKVDDAAVAEWIANAFKDREKGTFNRPLYEQIVNQRLPGFGIKRGDFERYVRHEVGIQHLAAVASIPGKLLTPQQAELKFRQENSKADTKVVFFNATNFLAQVQITPEALTNHYNIFGSTYRLPERMRLSFVAYPASNYFGKADQKMTEDKELGQKLDAMYTQRGANFFTDPTGQVMTSDAAKERLRNELRQELAMVEARKEAIALLDEIMKVETPPDTNNPASILESVAAQKGLVAELSAPFSQVDTPFNMSITAQAARNAFQLTPETPLIEEPLLGEDTVYVAALKNRIDSELPPFATLRIRVEEDFRRIESQKLARNAGNTFANIAKGGVERGNTLEQIAQESGQTVIDLPPFTEAAETIPALEGKADASAIKRTAFDLQEGKLSGFMPTREGGYVLLLEKLIPVSDEQVKQEIATYMETLRRKSQTDSFQEWFRKEGQNAQISLVTDRQASEMESDSEMPQ